MKRKDAVRVFANEAEFEAAYEKFLAGLPKAGKAIKDSHEKMDACFLGFLGAFEKWVFRHACEYGYRMAMERQKRGTLKEYRVKVECDGMATVFLGFDSKEQAMACYDSLGGKAEMQRYVEDIQDYETVVYPEFGF